MMKRVFLISLMCVMGVAAQADLISQPYIAGEFQDPTWQAGDTPMTSLGGGLWEYTITGTPGVYQQFKVTDGTWGTTAPASNSWYTIPASGEVTVTFNTNVVLDGWLPEQFRVSVSTDPGVWSTVGDFNGWNNNDPTQAMTALGNGIYEKTQTFGAGTYLIKAVNTGSWDGIGPDGRSMDAKNLNLTLASDTSVTIYIDAFNGLIGTGDTVSLNKPFDPAPVNNAVVPVGTVTDLGWTNPDPIVETDTLGVSVKFERELEPDGSGGYIYDPNWGGASNTPTVTSTASGSDIESVLLSAMTPAVGALPDDSLFSWQVTITDPNTGGSPVVTEGTVWLFEVGDAPPVVSQPVGEYMYLSQDDSAVGGIGDTNPNVRYFEVTASYTDDGKSPITVVDMNNLSWGWDPDGINGEVQRGVTEVSDVHTPGTGGGTVTAIYKTEYDAADPNYSTDLPGNWNIRLEVTDGSGTATGSSSHYEIHATCGGAAYADPTDTFDGTYDFNGDCIVSLPDFSDFAAAWLNQGVKWE